MKTLKSILIGTIVIMSFADANSQSLNKADRDINFFKNKLLLESPNPHRSLGTEYSFSVTTGTYSDLTGTTSINNNEIWDDPEYVIPIGFNFDLYDLTIDSLYFTLGSGGLVSNSDDFNEADYAILPFEVDLIDRGYLSGTSISPISYKLEGSPGNRILKVEWKNAGFFYENLISETLNDFINLQLWLYEGTNDIEFHFGSNMITDPTINYDGETGAVIGLADVNLFDLYLLSGNPSNPVMENALVILDGTPSDGTIYRFSKNSSSILSNISIVHSIKIYPNPLEFETIIEVNHNLNDGYLTIYNSLGQIVKLITNISGNQLTLQRDNLSSGLYFIKMTERGKLIGSGKFIVKD